MYSKCIQGAQEHRAGEGRDRVGCHMEDRIWGATNERSRDR